MPTINTLTPSNLEATSATLRGWLSNMGGHSSVYCYIRWRKGTSGDWTIHYVGNFSSTQTFTRAISGLDSDTIYQNQAYGTHNLSDWTYGDIANFKTKEEELPKVITKAASSVGISSARLNAEITDMGDYNNVWGDFEYRKGTSGSWTYVEGSSYSSAQNYNETITGLDDDTYYTFRAVLEYSDGMVYGGILGFTTDEKPIETYPIKYWNGSSWTTVDRSKLKFRVGGSWVGDQKIKVRVGSSWVEA